MFCWKSNSSSYMCSEKAARMVFLGFYNMLMEGELLYKYLTINQVCTVLIWSCCILGE